ncbi:MipA/OmpV family protein [Chitinibacteraceae bacterium HSL-7]
MRRLLRFLPAIFLAAFAQSQAAEIDLSSLDLLAEESAESPIPNGFVFGAAGIAYTSRYTDAPRNGIAVPGFVYLGKHMMYLGDRARYYFYTENGVGLFGYGRVRFGNLDPEDSDAWAGMNKRKWELEAGVGASIITPYNLMTLRVATDMTGTSDGQEALLWSDFPIIRGRAMVMPGVGLVWRSSKLANYYFGGVSAQEATATRPEHDTGSTLTPMTSLVTAYRINKNWLASAIVGVEFYASGTKDSPLVDRSTEITGILAAGYIW